jgi:hypothetical protein
VQDGHEQIVMPLAIPVERLAQTAFMVKAALLIDPLSPQVEVVDTEAHPVQADGAQCEVEDEPGDLGSVALIEHVRPGEPDANAAYLRERPRDAEAHAASEQPGGCLTRRSAAMVDARVLGVSCRRSWPGRR